VSTQRNTAHRAASMSWNSRNHLANERHEMTSRHLKTRRL